MGGITSKTSIAPRAGPLSICFERPQMRTDRDTDRAITAMCKNDVVEQ